MYFQQKLNNNQTVKPDTRLRLGDGYVLKPIRVFPRKSGLSRPACCYDSDKLREAVGQMNAVLAELKLEQYPDKTFIGRLSRGFDAFGYQFSEEDGLSGPSAAAVQRFGARIAERYAQHESRESLLHYVTRWLGWQFGSEYAASGVSGSKPKIQAINKTKKNGSSRISGRGNKLIK